MKLVELFMLWLIVNTAKLLEKIILIAFLLVLYALPPYSLMYGDGDKLVDGICLFWIIVLYPATFLTLAYSYYRHLICKYRDGKMPNNECTKFMEFNDLSK